MTDSRLDCSGVPRQRRPAAMAGGSPAGLQNPVWTRLATLGVQSKPLTGGRDDPLEREAERVADQVMHMPPPSWPPPDLAEPGDGDGSRPRNQRNQGSGLVFCI
jgi:hypothetical protein